MNKETRKSNIELLRVFSMFMIVLYHIICHCVVVQLGEQPSIELGKKYFYINAFYPWGTTGNNIFLLISGYFTASSKNVMKLEKISKKLLSQLLFAVIFLVAVSNMAFRLIGDSFDIRIENFMDMNNGRSWFIGYYFLVIVIGFLFLNNFLDRIDKDKYVVLLLSTFAIIQFSWSSGFFAAFGGGGGLRLLLNGMFLYSLGGFIKKYNPFEKVRTFSFLLIVIALYAVIYISTVNFKEIIRYSDYNFLVIVLAVCIFEIFTRIKIPNIRLINFIGSSTFMIYLLHDSSFFYGIWNRLDWISLLVENPEAFILDLFLWGAVSFIVGVLGYGLYLIFIKIFIKIKGIFVKY